MREAGVNSGIYLNRSQSGGDSLTVRFGKYVYPKGTWSADHVPSGVNAFVKHQLSPFAAVRSGSWRPLALGQKQSFDGAMKRDYLDCDNIQR
jgi:hypothetical protein